jgi:hypothetical protein
MTWARRAEAQRKAIGLNSYRLSNKRVYGAEMFEN